MFMAVGAASGVLSTLQSLLAQGTAGIGYKTIESLKGVQHLDKYDNDRALLLVRNDAGQLNLQTVELP